MYRVIVTDSGQAVVKPPHTQNVIAVFSMCKDAEAYATRFNLANKQPPVTQRDLSCVLLGLETGPRHCHGEAVSAGWWSDPETGQRAQRSKSELIALMHSELSEMLEGVRKSKPGSPHMDRHCPDLTSEEVEAADLILRIFDYAGAFNLDLARAVGAKLAYNRTRADNQLENRLKAGGKVF